MAKQPVDYKKLTEELDEILDKLQSQDLAIDEALELHKRGEAIIAQLEQYLESAENTVTAVIGSDKQG